ncbi:MAG: GntR family transcriptional regulator [Gemmatimonadaceae bacterium]
MINFVDDVAKWEQVYQLLRKRIESGTYAERRPIPSIRQLIQELGVADGTIQKALTRLKKEQLIRSIHGKGTFVRPREFWAMDDD